MRISFLQRRDDWLFISLICLRFAVLQLESDGRKLCSACSIDDV